ncbi:phage tail tape measure protein [Paenarthrobacter sp. NPDC089714]|uniref:phage tail tape measure protein n=1 Tax=Paenarthrobacter sp. NPDC089714 TaxID=3364377 RepID=UPI0038294EE3
MADAVELAAAYVSLVPSFEGSQGTITKQLVPEAEKAGNKAAEKSGQTFGAKFSGVLGSSGFQAGLAGGVAAVGLALADGFASAIESSDARNKTAAQLGLNPAESAAAGEAAGSLYAGAYGESLTDVNAAVGSVMSSIGGMRQASSSDLEDITEKALNLQEAFEVGVGETSATAGILIKNGLAKDADQAMDMITASMQKVPASVRGEVLPIMDEYSKHFAGLGIDGETAMGMIVAASADGAIGMDKMGDAVKEFQIRSTDMSKSTAAVYESMGMDTEDMTRRLLAGGDSANQAMGEIVHGLQSIDDPAAQSAASLALFGTPLEDLGADQIPNFLGMMDPMGDKFDSTAGAADAFGTQLNSGPGTALEGLKRSVETTFMSFAETAMPAITAFSGWLTENQWVIATFATLVGATLVGAFIAWAASVWVANVALLANPMTWIILGIVALIAGLVLLVANWDAVVAWVSGVWGGFVGWLTDGLNAFVAWWNGIWAGFAAFWGGIFENAKNTAVGIFTAIVDWIRNVPQMILDGLMALASLYVQFGLWILSVKDAAVEKFGEVVGWVGQVPQMILDGLGNLSTLLLDAGGQIIDGFFKGLTQGFEDVKNFVGGIGEWIANNKGPKAYDLALLIPAGGWIMTGLGKGIRAGIPDLKRELSGVSDTIANGIQGGSVELSGNAYGLGEYDVAGSGSRGSGGDGPLVEQHIHTQPGMSEETVGRISGDQMAFELRKLDA